MLQLFKVSHQITLITFQKSLYQSYPGIIRFHGGSSIVDLVGIHIPRIQITKKCKTSKMFQCKKKPTNKKKKPYP